MQNYLRIEGSHPLIWGIALGLEQSASTFFFMDEGADTGDILSQVEFEIRYEDDSASIYEKMMDYAITQLEEIILNLKQNKLRRIKQDHKPANTWLKRGK